MQIAKSYTLSNRCSVTDHFHTIPGPLIHLLLSVIEELLDESISDSCFLGADLGAPILSLPGELFTLLFGKADVLHAGQIQRGVGSVYDNAESKKRGSIKYSVLRAVCPNLPKPIPGIRPGQILPGHKAWTQVNVTMAGPVEQIKI